MKYHTLMPLIFALAVSPLGAQAPAIVGDGNADVTAAAQKAVDAGAAVRFAKGTHGGSADPKSLKPDIFQRQCTPMVDGIKIVRAHAENTFANNKLAHDSATAPALTKYPPAP